MEGDYEKLAEICVYLVPSLTYSASNISVTLKSGLGVVQSQLKMAPTDRSYTTYHWSAVVSIYMVRYLTLNNIVTLKSSLRGFSLLLEMAPFDKSHTSSYSSSILTMAVSCIIFEIKSYIGRKQPTFHTPFPFNWQITNDPLELLCKIFTRTARVYKLLESTKISTKTYNVTDRQTDGFAMP